MYKEINRRFSGGVFMLAKKNTQNVEFIGTGFLVSDLGYLLTCSHIINPLDSIVAISIENTNTFNPMTLSKVNFFELQLVQNDAINDVALLKFKNDIQPIVSKNIFGNSENVECGSSIAIIGFPFGNSGLHIQSLTHGIISSKIKTSSNVKLLQFDSMIHEGNSGSPLIELQTNKIIGIVTNRFNPSAGGATIMMGNRQVGVETNISYATAIEYGHELLTNQLK
ncbi:serine protease [Flavobacterium frigoris]|uniref:Trypsin domain/PDZ domain protein n=1 Tax=Flavobacterium frigoris (strain PS1) TaxID=1086011 RepID=H7FSS8_FLAFP|nr:serine protease [Flavobacterium frigoris]EIA08637.1 trypsin domain/PDZ domain protein [Flavobacterium frigoris PS1]